MIMVWRCASLCVSSVCISFSQLLQKQLLRKNVHRHRASFFDERIPITWKTRAAINKKKGIVSMPFSQLLLKQRRWTFCSRESSVVFFMIPLTPAFLFTTACHAWQRCTSRQEKHKETRQVSMESFSAASSSNISYCLLILLSKNEVTLGWCFLKNSSHHH